MPNALRVEKHAPQLLISARNIARAPHFQPACRIGRSTVTIYAELDPALSSKRQKPRPYSPSTTIQALVDWFREYDDQR